jgi:phosphoglycolate phosphatase
MTHNLVIFDVDGTLADSFPWFVEVFDTLAERYHFRRMMEQEGAMLRGMSARQIVQYLHVPAWKLPLIACHARMLAQRDRAQIALFPGVHSMPAKLAAAGIRLAVVSSNSEETVRYVLGRSLLPASPPTPVARPCLGSRRTSAVRSSGVVCGQPMRCALAMRVVITRPPPPLACRLEPSYRATPRLKR